MPLTGASDKPPLLPRRDYAARIENLVATVRQLSGLGGNECAIDERIASEKAAIFGLRRRGRISPGGTCRLIPTRGGWIAVNLARAEDRECVSAWLERDASADPWAAIEGAAVDFDGAAFAARGQLLGIPAAEVVSGKTDALPVQLSRRGLGVGVSKWPADTRLLVLDFSSLWAGPLCGNLLAQMGARVIKVESTKRPDGARFGPEEFFDLLHAGQESIAVNFAESGDLIKLKRLMTHADVIIESSRPRAFAQLGLDPAALFAVKPDLVWTSVTAYGRESSRCNHVGFGDDVAAAGGLLAWDEEGLPFFVGDAIADPLAGLLAAAGTMVALAGGGGILVDAAMSHAVAFVASAPIIEREHAVVFREGDQEFLRVNDVSERIRAPYARIPAGKAPPLGAHTRDVLAEFS